MKRFLTLLVLSLGLPAISFAGELTYKPVNPSFGGNPFNGAYLLSNATAQRQHDAPAYEQESALDNFADTVQRSILNRVASDIAESMLGEDAKDAGVFTVGDTSMQYQRQGDQVVIDMQNLATGESTVIEMPIPSY